MWKAQLACLICAVYSYALFVSECVFSFIRLIFARIIDPPTLNSLIPKCFVLALHMRLCIGPGKYAHSECSHNEVVVDAFPSTKYSSWAGMDDTTEHIMVKLSSRNRLMKTGVIA